jgi:formate dehydrogenase subunit gamma
MTEPAAGGRTVQKRRGRSSATVRILRFDRVQRAAHWANALLFGILILTALPLYFPSVERLVGRHVLIADIHVWTGVTLPIPLVVALIGPWGARMRQDVRRINRWTEQEVRWLLSFGREDGLLFDKFNPGQKLNAIFVAAAIVVMLGTGCMLKWFSLFPLSWRTGATFVHEVLAWVIFFVVFGHIVMALAHPASLRSMLRGWVTEKWARQHAPRWLEELQGPDDAEDSSDVSSVAGGRSGP